MRWVVGVDEAGRGPLAGPVAVGTIACAEEFDLLATFPGLNDSKQLTEPKREELFALLEEQVLAGNVRYHVELVSSVQIDTRGITHCVRRGVHRGVRALLPDPLQGKVFLDGLLKAPQEYEQETIVKGDSLVPAIMLASIAAKVTRDRLMVKLARRYPQYGFEKHKGYGTKGHQEALSLHGLCPLHRRTYVKNFESVAQVV